MTEQHPADMPLEQLKAKAYSGLVFFIITLGLFIFMPAWSIRYWQGWAYWSVFTISIVFITAYFLKHDRKLIERRLQAGPKAEKENTQKVIQRFAQFFFMGVLIFPAVDHHFQWTPVPPIVSAVALLPVVIGFYIIFRVFRENSFTSAIIEIGEEQKVISTGPYSVVRHPMYSGALLLFLATPLVLDSWAGTGFSVLLIIALVARIYDEEKFLRKNLPGYVAYMEKVKYRLLPGVF